MGEPAGTGDPVAAHVAELERTLRGPLPALMLVRELLGTSGLLDGPATPTAAEATARGLARAQDLAGTTAAITALVLAALTVRRTGSPRRVAVAVAVTVWTAVAVCCAATATMVVVDTRHAWLRIVDQPAGVLVHLMSAAVAVALHRSAARTLGTLPPSRAVRAVAVGGSGHRE